MNVERVADAKWPSVISGRVEGTIKPPLHMLQGLPYLPDCGPALQPTRWNGLSIATRKNL